MNATFLRTVSNALSRVFLSFVLVDVETKLKENRGGPEQYFSQFLLNNLNNSKFVHYFELNLLAFDAFSYMLYVFNLKIFRKERRIHLFWTSPTAKLEGSVFVQYFIQVIWIF